LQGGSPTYGRRETFLAGLVLFGVGSALCAAAPGLELLLAARFVQGMGGAVVAPLALGNTTRAVSDAQRGWAVGVFASGGTTLLVLGPLLAGALLAVASWRWLFLVNLPVVAFAVVVGWRTITPSREAVPKPLRWHAVGLLLIGLTAFVVGCVELGTAPGAVAAALLVGGFAFLALFVRHELRTPAPLIDLRLLRDRMLATSLTALFAIEFAVFGVTVPLALYLQHGLGLGPVAAGMVLALAGLGTPLLSVWIGRITDRTGPRRPALPGLALATVGLLAVALLAPLGSVAILLPGLLVFAVTRPMVSPRPTPGRSSRSEASGARSPRAWRPRRASSGRCSGWPSPARSWPPYTALTWARATPRWSTGSRRRCSWPRPSARRRPWSCGCGCPGDVRPSAGHGR
jgi:MFS family permease